MIYVTERNETGEIHFRKSCHEITPKNTERTYAVRRRDCYWEVHCIKRTGGKATRRLVAAVPSEQEADALARELVDPQIARGIGKRSLEEIIEDGL